MSQRSESYKELRQTFEKVVREMHGVESTNDVMKCLSTLWPVLLRTRAVMVKTLINRGDMTVEDKLQPLDFLNLYLQIHDPKKESRLCEHCYSSVEFGISECPYCGEHVNGPNSPQFKSQVVVDFDLSDKSPNWEIDYNPDEILAKGRAQKEIEAPEIKPITKRDDIIGPKGQVDRSHYKRKRDDRSRSTRDVIAWVMKRDLARRIPFTTNQLKALKKSELICLVSLFKENTDVEWTKLWTQPTASLIEFILGHQGSEPILDIGPSPFEDLDEALRPEVNNG